MLAATIAIRAEDGELALSFAGRALDLFRTYAANCKDAPALSLMVLPGFAPEALVRDATAALKSFKHFAMSVFGQRGRFSYRFRQVDIAASGCMRVRATFGKEDAQAYTDSAAAQGQDDLYVSVDAGEVVSLLCCEDAWTLVATHGMDAARGWVPSQYLAAVAA